MVNTLDISSISSIIYIKAKHYVPATGNNKHPRKFNEKYIFLSSCDNCQINW